MAKRPRVITFHISDGSILLDSSLPIIRLRCISFHCENNCFSKKTERI